jgi:hypothetical protein
MGRIIRSDSHKDAPRRHPGYPQEPKSPTGSKCGFCCISMWFKHEFNYSKFDCPVKFPGDVEYRKICIDYDNAFLHGFDSSLSIVSNPRKMAEFLALRKFYRAAKKITDTVFDVDILPTPLRENSLFSGEEQCENYYTTLETILNITRSNSNDNSFGLGGYTWSETGFCHSADCDCVYPCDFKNTYKLWNGGACKCASPLEIVNDECKCPGAESQKIISDVKYQDKKSIYLSGEYPLGECKCAETNDINFTYNQEPIVVPVKTLLKPTSLDANSDSDCDCECSKGSIFTKDSNGRTELIDDDLLVWNHELKTCTCDESLGLKDFDGFTNAVGNYGTDIDPKQLASKIRLCKCSEQEMVWDKHTKQCVVSDTYVNWGEISDITHYFHEDSMFPTDVGRDECPSIDGYIHFSFKLIVDHLPSSKNIRGADLSLSLRLSDNLSAYSYQISSNDGVDPYYVSYDSARTALVRDFIRSEDSKKSFSLPTTISIGEHFEKNPFSSQPAKDFYTEYSGLKQKFFKTNSSYNFNTYEINYFIAAKLTEFRYSRPSTFSLAVEFNNLRPYNFSSSNYQKRFPPVSQFGPGKSTKYLTIKYDPDTDVCSTEIPTDTPE